MNRGRGGGRPIKKTFGDQPQSRRKQPGSLHTWQEMREMLPDDCAKDESYHNRSHSHEISDRSRPDTTYRSKTEDIEPSNRQHYTQPASAPRGYKDSNVESSSESSKVQIPRRGKYIPADVPAKTFGEFGTEIDVGTNYVPVYVKPDAVAYIYHIVQEPKLYDKKTVTSIFRRHEHKLGRNFICTGKSLITSKKLEILILEDILRDGTVCRTEFKLNKTCTLDENVGIINLIILRLIPFLNLIEMSKKFYDPDKKYVLQQHGLEIWPGFEASVKQCKDGFMLCCDIVHSILRLNSVLTMMDSIMEDTKRMGRGSDMDLIQRRIKNLVVDNIVVTRYNNRSYKIHEVDFESTPSAAFDLKGEFISYSKYYERQYGLRVTDHNQPMLKHKVDVKCGHDGKSSQITLALVPEFSYLTGITDDIRTNFRVMKDISHKTFMRPDERNACLLNLISQIYDCQEAANFLNSWGIGLGPNPVCAIGRELCTEDIIVGKNTRFTPKNGNWTSEICKNPVLKAVDLTNWAVIGSGQQRHIIRSFIDMLTNICQYIGIHMEFPRVIYLDDERIDSYLRAIKSLNNIQIVITVLQSNRTDIYNAIKRLCCVDLSLGSQVVRISTISRKDKLRSVAFKILLQMNCKLGGELWRVDIPVSREGIMFVGIDVYHNSALKHLSVVGCVCSTNKECTSWYSVVHPQHSGQETMEFLQNSIRSALDKWYSINSNHPVRIMIYRDGVSESCLNLVNEVELKSVIKALRVLYQDNSMKLTFIVTNKRISTRYFPTKRNKSDNLNVPPGTVVDNTITNSGWYDFFMVSQNALQGTVRPIHYVVLYDKPNMKVDYIQGLAYKMSNLYYNWSGTISIPAPCRYAHKLAQFVGMNLQATPSKYLCDKLYYL